MTLHAAATSAAQTTTYRGTRTNPFTDRLTGVARQILPCVPSQTGLFPLRSQPQKYTVFDSSALLRKGSEFGFGTATIAKRLIGASPAAAPHIALACLDFDRKEPFLRY